MLYINNKEKLERIKLEKDNFYVVSDFDRTLTDGNANGTWEILEKSGINNNEYRKRTKELYNYYRPIEIDPMISEKERSEQMEIWWKKHVHLFYEFKLGEEDISESIKNSGLNYREGASEFLFQMKKDNVPVVIISAGIGNIISGFLKATNTDYENIKILSNFIKFTNGIIDTFEGEVIHSFNKNIVSLSEDIKETRKNILLLGDCIGDLKMVDNKKLEDTITVGFLEEEIESNLPYFNKSFDIVLTEMGSFYELNKVLNIR